MSGVHENFLIELFPFSKGIDATLDHVAHLQGKEVRRLSLSFLIDLMPEVRVGRSFSHMRYSGKQRNQMRLPSTMGAGVL